MKNYTTLIREAHPALQTLLIPFDDRNNRIAECVLQMCSMEVISSITVIMVIGRDALEYSSDYPARLLRKLLRSGQKISGLIILLQKKEILDIFAANGI